MPPVINRYTCVTAIMNPAAGRLTVRGWEENMPVTAIRQLVADGIATAAKAV